MKHCYYRVSEMVILALDSTSRRTSCAVLRDDVVLAALTSDSGRPAAAQLPGSLEAALIDASIALGDVDVFAVAVGPGSFTGLRVGIACMQGLAFARRRPLVGVSALDALVRLGRGSGAESEGTPRRTAAWIDAWRGEVYAALYEDGALVEEPTVEAPVDLLDRLAAVPTLFVGDGVRPSLDLIRERCGDRGVIADDLTPALAATIGRLAADRVREGDAPPPHAVLPLYVRRIGVERPRGH
jgi:tRNA threonylcarbamoyladenosine biosynthesis protein TsaB